MRKPLLLIAALTIAITSCQKPSVNNNPYSCTCSYATIIGFRYVKDTSVEYNYAPGTSEANSQLYCNNAANTLEGNVNNSKVQCFIHQ